MQDQFSLFSLNQMNAAGRCFDFIVSHQTRNRVAVDREPPEAYATHTDKIVAGFCRRDRAGPLHCNSPFPDELRWQTILRQIDILLASGGEDGTRWGVEPIF